MASLETKFLGMTFPNPFILGSGPPTATGPMIKEAFKAGWGGAVIKTLGLEPTTPLTCPRLHVIRDGKHKSGMVNTELITELTLEEWQRDIDLIREDFPDHPLIASIMGGGSPQDWQEVIHSIEPHGVNAFEMNVSCPNIAERKGAQLGQDPESLYQAVSWVREATKLPVIVKLTPNVTDIVSLAKVAVDAGADAVTATNTLSGLAGIDLEQFTPLPTIDGRGIFSGYSGPGLKPVSLRCAASIAKSGNIPIFGCGGINNWRDAAEFMAAGSSVVELCTAVMWNGFGIIKKLVNGLEKYLDTHGFQSPADIVGKALPAIVQYPGLNLEHRLVAKVDADTCTGCVICVRACDSGGYQAIYMQDKKAVINLEKCDGCGLCVGICPVDCISMELRLSAS